MTATGASIVIVAAACNALAGSSADARYPPASAVAMAAILNQSHCTPWKRAIMPVRAPFSTTSASMITSDDAIPKAVSVSAAMMVPTSVSPDSHRKPSAATLLTRISQVLRRWPNNGR